MNNEEKALKIREFLDMEIDIDVTDDVTEELYVAFVGPQALTEEGKKFFEDIFDLEVTIPEDHSIATVLIDHFPEGEWQKKLIKAKHLFLGAAGLCSSATYDFWFTSSNEENKVKTEGQKVVKDESSPITLSVEEWDVVKSSLEELSEEYQSIADFSPDESEDRREERLSRLSAIRSIIQKISN